MTHMNQTKPKTKRKGENIWWSWEKKKIKQKLQLLFFVSVLVNLYTQVFSPFLWLLLHYFLLLVFKGVD